MTTVFAAFSRLRVRLALIVALALAPVGVLAFIQALNGLKASAASRDAEFQALSLSAIDRERETLAEIRQAVKAAALTMQSSPELIGNCGEVFARLAEENPWMTSAVLVSPEGVTTCGAEPALSVAETEHWRRFRARRDFTISGAQTGRVSGKRIFAAYHPFPDPGGGVAAVAVGVDLDYFGTLARDGRPADSTAILGVDSSVMLANAGSEGETGSEAWLPEDRSTLRVFGDRAVRAAGADGVQRVYFTSALEPGQLWAVTARVTPGLGDLARSPEATALLIPILLWCIAVGVTYFAIDLLVSRHIERLRAAAFRIGQGDLETSVGDFEDAPRELRALGHSIKAMAARLAGRDARLQETLETQRQLLLEVHHRVKNNLQTISSLMNLELRRAQDGETRTALRQIQDRIHALALVHQNLYAAENVERIALDQLVGDICRHLETSLAPRGYASRIETDLAPVVVDTLMATPVALFLSEAVGNAYKHADRAAPGLGVTLRGGETEISISVANRTGAARDRREDEAGGLGTRLMTGFAKQLGGRLETESDETSHRVTLTAPVTPREGLFSIRKATA